MLNKGDFSYKNGDFRTARNYYFKATKVDVTNYKSFLQCARCDVRLGSLGDSISAWHMYQRAIEISYTYNKKRRIDSYIAFNELTFWCYHNNSWYGIIQIICSDTYHKHYLSIYEEGIDDFIHTPTNIEIILKVTEIINNCFESKQFTDYLMRRESDNQDTDRFFKIVCKKNPIYLIEKKIWLTASEFYYVNNRHSLAISCLNSVLLCYENQSYKFSDIVRFDALLLRSKINFELEKIKDGYIDLIEASKCASLMNKYFNIEEQVSYKKYQHRLDVNIFNHQSILRFINERKSRKEMPLIEDLISQKNAAKNKPKNIIDRIIDLFD